MTNNTPAPADLVEAVAKIASISVDEMRIHEEARERTTNDATQSGYDFHLIRVAAEHGARLAVHRRAAAITFDRDSACPICHMNEGCSHTVTERQRTAAITPQPDPRDAEIERLTKEADDHAEAASRWRSEAGNSEAEIERLREALTKAEADVARYQWLRDNSCPPHNFYISVPDEFHGICYSPQEVDAYIDEARAALAKSEGQ